MSLINFRKSIIMARETMTQKLRREIEILKTKIQDEKRATAQWEGRCREMEKSTELNQAYEKGLEVQRNRELEFLRELVKMLTIDPEKQAKYDIIMRENVVNGRRRDY